MSREGPAESVQESAANLLNLATWANEGEDGKPPGLPASATDTVTTGSAGAQNSNQAAVAAHVPAQTVGPGGATIAWSPVIIPPSSGLFRMVQVGGVAGVPQMMALSHVPQPVLAQKVGKAKGTAVEGAPSASASPIDAGGPTPTTAASPSSTPAPAAAITPAGPPSLPPMAQMIQMPGGGFGMPMLLANGVGAAGLIQLPPGAQLPPGGAYVPMPTLPGGPGAGAALMHAVTPTGLHGVAGGDDGSGPIRRRVTSGKQGWTREEDQHILHHVQVSGQKWSVIAAMLPGRTDDAVRNRYLRLQKKRMRGRYNRTEGSAPGNAPCTLTTADLADCASVKKGDMWAAEEDQRIMEGVARFGQKWQQISELLPGRSANAVRNRYLRCEGTGAFEQVASVPAAALAALGAMQRPPVTATIQPPPEPLSTEPESASVAESAGAAASAADGAEPAPDVAGTMESVQPAEVVHERDTAAQITSVSPSNVPDTRPTWHGVPCAYLPGYLPATTSTPAMDDENDEDMDGPSPMPGAVH